MLLAAAGCVLLVDASLVALGTVLTPLMTSTAGLMAAITRLIAPKWRGLATLFGRTRSVVFSAPGWAAR